MDAKRFSRHAIFLGLIVLGLSGCSSAPCDKYLKTPLYIPPQKLVKVPKPLNVIRRREYDICILQTHGVQVIRLGQTWTLVFPSDELFNNDTAEINEDYKSLLNTAADLMQTYSKITVAVTGYSDRDDDVKTKFGSIKDELTERQAESVANYLVSRHINSRLIYGVGRGSRDPVAWDGAPKSRRFNRRIEVHFRYYRDNTAWY